MRFQELLFEGKKEEEDARGNVTCLAMPVSDGDAPVMFAAGRSSGSLSLYSIHGNSFSLKQTVTFSSAVNDICFSSDSLQLAAVFEDSSIRIFSPRDLTLEYFATTPSKRTASTSCCFSPQNNLLVVGTGVGSILVFDVRNQQLVRKLSPTASSQAQQSPVSSVSFHPDGSVFMTTGTDGLARVWDSTGPCLATLIGSANRGIGSGVFSPNGRFALLGALEGEGLLGLWDLAHSGRLKRVRRYTRHNTKYWMRACFDGRGNIICGDERGQLRCLYSPNGEELCSIKVDIRVPLAVAAFQSHVACGGLGSAQPKLFVLV